MDGVRFVIVLLLLVIQCKADLELTILHTNDVHARVEQSNKFNGVCSQEDDLENKCYGGVARRYTKVTEIRNEIENVLLLDGGDQFQGTIWFSYYQGLASAHFMKRIGYDAMVLGNHEFDNGAASLAVFLQNVTSSFPVLSANLDATNEPVLHNLFNKSVVRTIDGEQVGIVGYISTDTPFLVDQTKIKNVVFHDDIASVKAEVERLQSQGINKIIGLGHSGYDIDIELAKQVAGIDVVVGGHSNTFLYTGDLPPNIETPEGDYPTVITRDDGSKALVVQAYAYGKYLGYLNVTFDDNGDLTSWGGNPILLDGSIEQDADILSEVSAMSEPLSEFRNNILGTSVVHLEDKRDKCRRGECNLGNLVTDAIVFHHLRPSEHGWTKGSIAFWNTGGIRRSIGKGNITMGDIMEVHPFRNQIALVTANGSAIRAILEHSAELLPKAEARFLQVSGLRMTYNEAAMPGKRVHSVQARCGNCSTPVYSDVEDGEIYHFLTSTFLIGGGDGYTMISKLALDIEYIGTLAQEATANYISTFSPLFNGEEGRIQVVNMTATEETCKPVSGGKNNQLTMCSFISFIVFHLINFTM